MYTKNNLMKYEKLLALSQKAYEVLDKKSKVLTFELMKTEDLLKYKKYEIDLSLKKCKLLMNTTTDNISKHALISISNSYEADDTIDIQIKKFIGCNLVKVTSNFKNVSKLLSTNNFFIEDTFVAFSKLKILLLEYSECNKNYAILNSNMNKIQKRSNAIKYVAIPKYYDLVKKSKDVLEEQEREELSRVKIAIKVE